MKRVLLILKLTGAVLLGFITWFIVAILKEMRLMKRSVSETEKVTDDVFVVKDRFVNLFLIKSDEGYIAIDCCQDEGNVTKQLNSLYVNPKDVKHIFLTHSDYDHTGAIDLFPTAEVHISKKEHLFLKGGKRTFGFIKLGKPNELNRDYKTFESGQIFEIGEKRVECIVTPGHTSGSASFIVDDKYIFTGDTVSIRDSKITAFSRLISMDNKENLKSVDTIKQLIKARGIEYVFTAHHGYKKMHRD